MLAWVTQLYMQADSQYDANAAVNTYTRQAQGGLM